MKNRTWFPSLVLLLAVGLLPAFGGRPCLADDETPLGKFLTVRSPVDDVMFGKVQNTALGLQSEAKKHNRKAFLILEITPGATQFHQIRGLAKFLTSSEVSEVTTVAWIPETVTGNKVVLALACKEIIMHPDAELGDIGRGKTVDQDDQQFVVSLVDKRHNRKVNAALAVGMMDRQKVLLKITVESGGAKESKVVTQEELKRLADNNTVIPDPPVTIKDRGFLGTFSGSTARELDILAVRTLETRRDVVEHYGLPDEAMREDPTAGGDVKVVLIEIKGMIEPVLEAFLERQIERAIASGANTIIFEIDSPGGYLHTSENLALAIADLEEKNVRTVAYVPKGAYSGAAIIAMGCDEIYLHPDAQIGDAGPIGREGDVFARAPEKVLSPLRDFLATLAERKNRSPALLMAMADRNLKVYQATNRDGIVKYMTDQEIRESNGEWTKGELVFESRDENLLTVSGKRAHELKLAMPPVKDFGELRQRLGIPPQMKLKAAGQTWIDTLIFVLNTRTAMFLLIFTGILCIYLELHMTTGLLGIVSILCFSLFFWSRFLGGTAGWLEVVLFLLGLGCILLEIFVIPGFGVFGVTGGLLVFASVLMACQTFGHVGQGTNFQIMGRSLGTLSASIISVIVMAMLLSRFLPHMPFFNQMILTPPAFAHEGHGSGPQLRPEFSGSAGGTILDQDASLVGRQGTAATVLRPSGKAHVEGRYIDVVSDGPYIPAGSAIEVTDVAGNRVTVRQMTG